MRIGVKAQVERAERGDKGLEVFKAAIAQTDDRLARIHGIWGVSQLARADDRHASLLLPLLKDEDAEIRAQAAKWLGDIRFEGASQELVPSLLDTAARVRFFAVEALGRIGSQPAVQTVIGMLEAKHAEDVCLRKTGG